jgi:hypothetical protein
MKYFVSLQKNFIDIQSFLKKFTNSKMLFDLPPDYFECCLNGSTAYLDTNINQKSQPPAAFMVGEMLYVPLHIGWSQGGGIYGFYFCRIAKSASSMLNYGDGETIDNLADAEPGMHCPPRQVKMVKTNEDFKKNQIKLSAQCLKMLKATPMNSKIFYPGSSSRGFKCKAEDVVKAFAMGYIKLPESKGLLEALCSCNYPLEQFMQNKENSTTSIYAKFIECCKSETEINNQICSIRWNNVVPRISIYLERTDKALDETCATKWRKPNKHSKWPYTLDHHWFESQESPISLQHHTLASLMGSSRRSSNMEKLYCDLPVFANIRLLELCRKGLEFFFNNLQRIILANTSEYGQYVSAVNSLEWPNSRYSSRRLSPEMFPVKACLALGVMPTFDSCGVFQKFVPIASKFCNNTKILYYSVDPNGMFTTRRPDITLLLCYSTGLMNIAHIEHFLGPIGTSSDVLKADRTKINLKLSNNVVCCMPMEAAHEKVSELLAKQGVIFHINKANNLALSSITINKEFEELDHILRRSSAQDDEELSEVYQHPYSSNGV